MIADLIHSLSRQPRVASELDLSQQHHRGLTEVYTAALSRLLWLPFLPFCSLRRFSIANYEQSCDLSRLTVYIAHAASGYVLVFQVLFVRK